HSSPGASSSKQDRPVTSPVMVKDKGLGTYAVERAKVVDFHIPGFRTSPERKIQADSRARSSPVSVMATSPVKQVRDIQRDIEWDEIEAYFTYLNRDDKSTSTTINGQKSQE